MCPPLSTRRHIVSTETQEDAVQRTEPQDEDVALDDLLRGTENILFISQREGGKTSLANHISVLASEGMCDKDRIPVIVRYRYIQRGRSGIIEEFQSYYKSSSRRMDCGNLIEKGELLVIVDDASLVDQSARQKIEEITKSFPSIKFIFMADSSGLLGDTAREELAKFLRLVYVKPLPRRSIREMSRRWCQITGIDDTDTNNFIVRQVKENNLPRTGYIVSLLIWAYQKQKKMEKINEAYLLNAVIDNLLNKSDFTQALRKNFDPISAEITLQEIALYLNDQSGICTTNDLLEYVVKFFKKKALDFNALEIINQLERCGILLQQGNTIQFKYKCFQEYFIAINLKENDAYRQEIVKNHALKYSRELYLLSGLRRRNDDLIKEIRNRLETNLPPGFSDIKSLDFSRIAKQNVYDQATHKKITALKTKKMTTDQVDDLLDAAEKELEDRKIHPPRQHESSGAEKPSSNNIRSNDVNHRTLIDFIEEVSLFDSIVKNSEFDDGEVKLSALKFYFDLMIVFLVHISDVMSDVVDRFVSDKVKDDIPRYKTSDILDKNTMKSKFVIIMQRIMAMIITLKFSNDIATEKLQVSYLSLLEDPQVTPEIKLFVSIIMYDINQEGWEANLKNYLDVNDSPFILDLTTERLWHDLYTRYEPSNRRAQISRVVDHISEKISSSGDWRKSRQAVDKAANITQARGRV